MPNTPLKLLQIGAGSMGSRRLRDLVHRKDVELAILDSRADRRESAERRFSIRSFASLENALAWKPIAFVISSPPKAHSEYVNLAMELGLHHFSEANIWTPDVDRIISQSAAKSLVSAPSVSLHFLDVVRQLRQAVAGELGNLHSYQMTLSTYMPLWHPGEGPEYYARDRSTSAGREMVPFELLWLNEVFGPPAAVSGRVAQRGQLPGMTEDVWSLQMELQSGATGQLIVTMGARRDCREGVCVGTNGVLRFDIVTGQISRQVSETGPSSVNTFGGTGNRDALERAYFGEINCFVDSILGRDRWPVDYRFTAIATAALAACEASAQSKRAERVDVLNQPATMPPELR